MSSRSIKSSVWIGLFWLALGLINGTQIVTGMHAIGMRHNWPALFFVFSISWLIWAVATPLVFRLGHRFPPVRASGWKGWSLHVLLCLTIGVVDIFWNACWQYALNPYAFTRTLTFRYCLIEGFYDRFHVELLTYTVILAVGYTIDSLQRLAQREAELSKAQLDALRRQIEPHFLFNTLNGIAGLVRNQQNNAAVDMLAGLSDLLRRVLEGSERQLVPLAEELSFAERYIELQRMRFGDRLTATIEVPVELYGALVPSLILQPLIENAIRHGIEQREGGGSICVRASERGGVLTLAVHNDGPGLSPVGAPVGTRAGVGIENTRGRLRTIYGVASALEIRNHESVGVEMLVTVPYENRS